MIKIQSILDQRENQIVEKFGNLTILNMHRNSNWELDDSKDWNSIYEMTENKSNKIVKCVGSAGFRMKTKIIRQE